MSSDESAAWQIPAYTVAHATPRRTRFALCVFVLNEGEKIRKQLRAMAAYPDQVDLLIADGGSTDGSFSDNILEECGVTALLVKTGPGRLSAQMRMGLAYAMQQGYEGVVTIDGNGKDGLEGIPRMLAALSEGWDHVQGSRFIPGGHHAHTPALRFWGVQLLHAPVLSLAARFRYTDTTNGFRAYSRAFLLDPRIQPFREVFSGYELHYYLAIRAARLGFRVKEVPVSRCYPSHGPVPTKISGWRGNTLVLRTLLNAARGQYNPTEAP